MLLTGYLLGAALSTGLELRGRSNETFGWVHPDLFPSTGQMVPARVRMAKTKPYRSPLAAELADEILSIPLPDGYAEGREPERDPKTIGENLEQALDRLQEAVELANSALHDNQMVGIVAKSLAKTLKKRGVPSIRVEDDGSVVLRVDYPDQVPQDQEDTAPVVKGKWHSDLPKLAELRAEADELGIPHEDLGRARRAIYERIQEAKSRLRHMDEVKVAPLRPTGPPNGGGHVDDEGEGGDAPVPLSRAGSGRRRGT